MRPSRDAFWMTESCSDGGPEAEVCDSSMLSMLGMVRMNNILDKLYEHEL